MILCSSLFFVPKLHELIPLAGSREIHAYVLKRWQHDIYLGTKGTAALLHCRAANGSEIDTRREQCAVDVASNGQLAHTY